MSSNACTAIFSINSQDLKTISRDTTQALAPTRCAQYDRGLCFPVGYFFVLKNCLYCITEDYGQALPIILSCTSKLHRYTTR